MFNLPFSTISCAVFAESKEERMVMTIGEIIQELLLAHEQHRDVDLNKLKTRISSKYGLESSPRLVDIIAAVPSDAKSILLPKLKAKPIRTASGVSLSRLLDCKISNRSTIDSFADRRCRRDVQASQMSSHKHDGKHLCLLSWWT